MLTSSHVFMTPLTPRHFPASWIPCGTFPLPLSCWWHWPGITLAAVPAALCLLKAGGTTHYLDAFPCVSIKHRRLHAMERWRAKHSTIREPKMCDFLQSPALPLRTLYFKLCLLLPSLLSPGIPGCKARGDRACFGVYSEGLEQQPQVDARAKRKETCSVN